MNKMLKCQNVKGEKTQRTCYSDTRRLAGSRCKERQLVKQQCNSRFESATHLKEQEDPTETSGKKKKNFMVIRLEKLLQRSEDVS